MSDKMIVDFYERWMGTYLLYVDRYKLGRVGQHVLKVVLEDAERSRHALKLLRSVDTKLVEWALHESE